MDKSSQGLLNTPRNETSSSSPDGLGSDGSSNSSISSPVNVLVNHSEALDKGKKYTVYQVTVCASNKSWYLYKRYNEFSKLYEQVRKSN